jgi:hypothetical protein
LVRSECAVTKLVNPVLFTQRFPVSPSDLQAAGLLDPILNSDTKLFIDPLLLATSGNPTIRTDASTLLERRFGEIVGLVAASRATGDKAWRTAVQRLNLNERSETGLGYGGASTSGSSRPVTIKQQVIGTLREIVELGEQNPRIVSLMGLFEEGVGPDTISDLTTNLILPVLAKVTHEFCAAHRIPLSDFPRLGVDVPLPENPLVAGKPVILVPRDILRDLPLAADWSDVSNAIFEIEAIREAVNDFLGSITQATLVERKKALRAAVLSSLDRFRQVFEIVLNASHTYDPNEDVLNFYALRRLLTGDLEPFRGKIKAPTQPSQKELARVVGEIIGHFQHMVEQNNLWELLWTGGRPKRERAAQLLFFGVADVFCKANNIDISPETHSGGGPVDFKFSTGYDNRILVEVKRSTGTVVHGYNKQLETYKTAARTDAAIFLVIDVGGMGNKLETIQEVQRQTRDRGDVASEIVVIDATPKASASKRS